MTSCFPDVNVWLALSDPSSSHWRQARSWLEALPAENATLIFARHTQLGLLRLLTNQAAMGAGRLTLGEAWSVYDRWLEDPRVAFHPEPRDLEIGLREITAEFASEPASKALADCYLLALAKYHHASLVTFDRALVALAKKHRCHVVLPA